MKETIQQSEQPKENNIYTNLSVQIFKKESQKTIIEKIQGLNLYFNDFKHYLSRSKGTLKQDPNRKSAIYTLFSNQKDAEDIAILAEFFLFPLLFSQMIQQINAINNQNNEQNNQTEDDNFTFNQKVVFAQSYKQLPLRFTYRLASLLYMKFCQVDIFQKFSNAQKTFDELKEQYTGAEQLFQQLQADCLQALHKQIQRPSCQVLFRYKLQQQGITDRQITIKSFNLLRVLASLNIQADIDEVFDFAVKEIYLLQNHKQRQEVYNQQDYKIRQLMFTFRDYYNQEQADSLMPLNDFNYLDFIKYKQYLSTIFE